MCRTQSQAEQKWTIFEYKKYILEIYAYVSYVTSQLVIQSYITSQRIIQSPVTSCPSHPDIQIVWYPVWGMHRWCLHTQLASPNPLPLALLPWTDSPVQSASHDENRFLVCLGCVHHHRTSRGHRVHDGVSRGGSWGSGARYCVPWNDCSRCSFSRGGGACCRTFRSSGTRCSSLHGDGALQYTFSPSCHGQRNCRWALYLFW